MSDSDIPPGLVERQGFLERVAAGIGYLVECNGPGASGAAKDADIMFRVLAASGACPSREHADLDGTNVVT